MTNILIDYIDEKSLLSENLENESKLMQIMNNFHKFAKQLEIRHDSRNTLQIKDEYDL